MSVAPAGVEVLPALYEQWMASLLVTPIPRERRATCDTCAMCRPAGDPRRRDDLYFDPAAKCCTFTPTLPNFLVGRILADGEAAMADGRATVRRRIEARLAVTPLGVGQPPDYASLYEAGTEAFGRSRALRCPHYVESSGRCGIWRHREAVCTTWFCKHGRGQVGYAFWRDALQRLLRVIEDALAKWCVIELDIGDDALEALADAPAWTREANPLTAEALNHEVDEAAYAKLWGAWRGRELDFYQRCGVQVEALSWDAVLALAGAEGRALARVTRHAFARLTSDALPPALTPGEMTIQKIGAETARIVTYSAFDPLDVPNVVVALLPFFDGRPTDDAIAAIAARTGVTLEFDLVRKLADFGVLKPPAP